MKETPAHNLRTDLGSTTRIDYGTTLRDRSQEMWMVEAPHRAGEISQLIAYNVSGIKPKACR